MKNVAWHLGDFHTLSHYSVKMQEMPYKNERICEEIKNYETVLLCVVGVPATVRYICDVG